jgi:hypothetical protein
VNNPQGRAPGDQPDRAPESTANLERRAARGRLWIIAIAAVSLGLIGCMCAFIFLVAFL